MAGNDPHTDSGLKSILRDVRLYVEKRLELFTITISEQVASILAESIHRIAGFLILGAGLMIFWFAIGYLLGELLESVWLGFLISSIPLILFGLLFVNLRPKWLTRKIQSDMVEQILNSIDEVDDAARNGRRERQQSGVNPAEEQKT